MMKKIALHGMVSSRNFGDILMVDIVSKYLAQKAYDISIPMACSAVLNDLSIKQNNHGFWSFNSCDNLVYTGGGYFGPMANRNFSKDLKMILKFASPSEFFIPKSGHHIIGVGVNGLDKYQITKSYMKRLFNSAGTLAVRDEESLFELEKIGVRHSGIEVLADIALNIQLESIPANSLEYAKGEISDLRCRYEKVIALHLSGVPDEKYYDNIYAGILKYAEKNKNVGFVLIEDHPSSTNSSPQILAAQYLKNILLERAKIIPYTFHWNLVAVLSQIDGIVTNKLHVAIVSSALNKIAIAFTKHEKNHRFFAQIEASERCSNLQEQNPNSVYTLMENEFHYINRGEIIPVRVRDLARRNLELVQQNLIK